MLIPLALGGSVIGGQSGSAFHKTASFRGLRPANPLGSGGWGAWELKARYSDIDLDFLPSNRAATGAIALRTQVSL